MIPRASTTRLVRCPNFIRRKPVQRMLHVILKCTYFMLTTFLTMSLLLEVYYIEQCPVNPVLRANNEQVLLITINMFRKLRIPYSATCGTLLQVARNSRIAPWDQDSDLIIEKPSSNNAIDNLMLLMNKYLSKKGYFNVVYFSTRDLIQIQKNEQSLAHVDIWLFENIDNRTLKNSDYTVTLKELPYDWVRVT